MDDETVSSMVKLLKDLRSNIEDAEMPEIKNE